MYFPEYRMRRLRRDENLRRLMRETTVLVDDLIYPMFVVPGKGVRKKISSMPGIEQLSIDTMLEEVREVESLGIPAIVLFGIPENKDDAASEAYAENGIVQTAIRAVKQANISTLVLTDVCLCEYMTHGHCGVVQDGHVLNDVTLELLAETAVSHAEAGADMVAPSDMMDGRVAAIRSSLDDNGFHDVPIMSYAAKYASAFYGPFREAVESEPQFGDRRSYQMDPSNTLEALREASLDIEEGADIIMVKPALAYLDVIRRVKDEFRYPTAAYNVSGEYAAIKGAASKGWLEEEPAVMEVLTSIKRAGADMILTYHAKDVATWLK